MARSRVIDRDHGYRNVIRELGKESGAHVYVGILQDKGAEVVDGGVTLAGYAAVNEFGSADGHVPERSFLRSTVDENRAEYQQALDEATGDMIDAMVARGLGSGHKVLEQRLGQLGAKAAGDVKEKIRDLKDPPNAPSTLAAKYPGDNPLIDDGRMRQSVSFKVEAP
jgi:hypothetical protein